MGNPITWSILGSPGVPIRGTAIIGSVQNDVFGRMLHVQVTTRQRLRPTYVEPSIQTPGGAVHGAPYEEAKTAQDRLKLAMQLADEAQKNHHHYVRVPITLLISRADSQWTVDLRHAPDQFGVPLPSDLSFTVAKDLTCPSSIRAEGLPLEGWSAQAVHNERSLTVYLTELNSTESPIQIQLALLEKETDVDVILWRVDRNAHRSISWRGSVKRLNN
jgi:hypothetical protein